MKSNVKNGIYYDSLIDNLTMVIAKGSNIAIYGIGNAAYHVNMILSKHFHILGFLDRDPLNIGKEAFGLKILALDEAMRRADAVVIAANNMYWNNIARRIEREALHNGVKIFFTDGTAYQPFKQSIQNNLEYWNYSIEHLEEKCRNYDIISFDLFDTLLTRKIADPADVFGLIEKRGFRCDGFSIARRNAERKCAMDLDGIYSLDNIYVILSKSLNLSKEQCRNLRQMELDTELMLLTPRHDMTALFKRLVVSNKRLIIISDMYLSSMEITEILLKHGIVGYENLFVSCDEGLTKKNGGLWKKVLNYAKNSKILHIGDNVEADITMARAFGIEAFHVMRPVDMLASSTCGEIITKTSDIGECIATGLIGNRLFNSPFALYGTNGKPRVTSHADFGYVFFGPIMLNFMIWFLSKLRLNTPDIVLLFARDGYFIKKLYDSLHKLEAFSELPESVYFKTSRRMCSVPSFYTAEDVFLSLKKTFTGTLNDLFRLRFGLNIGLLNGERVVSSFEIEVYDKVCEYMDEILKNAEIERKRYIQYISRVIPKNCEKIAIFDLGFNGTIQFSIQKLLEREIDGYYLFYSNNEENPYYSYNKAEALYLKTNDLNTDNNYSIFRDYPILESVFTAPEGTYMRIGSNGAFETDSDSENYNRFACIEEIQRGIEEFIVDYLKLTDDGIILPNKEYSDIVLSMVHCADIDETIKQTCKFEDFYRGIKGLRGVFE